MAIVATWVVVAALGVGPARADASTIRVPQDRPSLQAALDAAHPGDTILVDRGTWAAGVTVPFELHDLTIRGVDRNAVVLDGRDAVVNGIEVHADGVTIENMTAHDFLGNAFYWDGVDRFAGRYLTVYNVGSYGIYGTGAGEASSSTTSCPVRPTRRSTSGNVTRATRRSATTWRGCRPWGTRGPMLEGTW